MRMTGLSYPIPLVKEVMVNVRRLPGFYHIGAHDAKVRGQPLATLLRYVKRCWQNGWPYPQPDTMDVYTKGYKKFVGQVRLEIQWPAWIITAVSRHPIPASSSAAGDPGSRPAATPPSSAPHPATRRRTGSS